MTLKWFHFEQCASTNDEAWNLDTSVAEDVVCVVLADRQTSGRGRKGRAWESSEGNLFVSILLSVSVDTLSWVPIIAGISAYESLENFVGENIVKSSSIRIKWPNDIFLGADTKLGGILCESRIRSGSRARVVIGLGLNLNSAPTLSQQKTTSVLEKFPSQKIDRKEFTTFWVGRIIEWLTVFKNYNKKTLEELKSSFLACAKLSQFPLQQLEGQALGLDDFGRLQVRNKDGSESFLDQPIE